MKLNIGGGEWNPDGFVSVDRTNGQEAYPLAYADGSVDEIRASHILEHFPHGQVRAVVRDWVRSLKVGGLVKIAVPDFAQIAKWYAEGRKELPLQFYLMGAQTDENDYHKTAFVEPYLRQIMEEAGLVDIQPWASEIEDTASLEVSLNLQGTKPAAEYVHDGWAAMVKPFNVYSQFGEDGYLKAIFDKIGVESRYCVDVGAADGILFSNVRRFIEQEWRGLLIEADEERFKKLASLYDSVGFRVKCFNHAVEVTGARSLDALLDKADVPREFDLLNIDIDGQDYYIWNSLLTYSPRVVVAEYDPEAAYPMFIPPLGGVGQAGWNAMTHVAAARGYLTIFRTRTNIICVRRDIVEKHWKVGDRGTLQLDSRHDHRSDDSERSAVAAPKPSVIDDWGTNPNPTYGRHYMQHRGLGSEQGRVRAGVPTDGNSVSSEDAATAPGAAVRCTHCGHKSAHVTEFCGECGGRRTLEAIFPTNEPAAAPESLATLSSCTYAVLSVPRLGFNDMWHGTVTALQALGIRSQMVTGVYWGQCLTRGIEQALASGAELILTIDYDTLFRPEHVIKLCQLLADNPEYDIVVPRQMKRESDQILFQMNGDRDFSKPLTTIATGHFGLTVFQRDVFQRLSKPWLIDRPDPNGGWGEGHEDADIVFWRQVQAAGMKVGLANEVSVGHLELMVAWPDNRLQKRVQSITEYREQGQPKDCGGGLTV